MRIFEKVGMSKPKMSGFDKSHERKMSFNMGELVPCFMDEVVPGDRFKVNTEIMLRFAPMIAPVMHRVNVYVHYFFVPNRIVWDEWEDFITGGRLGTSSPTMPTINWGGGTGTGYQEGSLGDYLGLPVTDGTVQAAPINVCALPFRAYQKIYNDFYRDQTQEDEVDYTVTNQAFVLRQRAWEKDYFTSATPWTQRGTSPSIPLEGSASLTYRDAADLVKEGLGTPAAGGSVDIDNETSEAHLRDSAGDELQIRNLDDVDVSSAGVDVNELRKTTAIQRWLEKQARGGGRYIETILSHFGVSSSDKRLQRAEYLGGGRQPVIISEVLNTSATATEPQGNMAGHGVSVGNINHFSSRFEEHGYVFGIMSVLPKTAYQQGVHKQWLRDDKQDFYWPEYAHLGEQAVQNAELYYDGADGTYNDGTFGYQQRYAEMKYACNTVHGEFRSSYNHWHCGRIFGSQPVLNNDFVKSDPTDRIFAVTAGSPDQILCQVYNNVKALRPMPYFADPRLI